MEYAIALQSLFAKTDENRAWLAAALARLDDDKLVEIRLRWALAEQDWPTLAQTLPLLSAESAGRTPGATGQAFSLEQQGNSAGAAAGFESLAKERSYYGFLAADRLGLALAFNHDKLTLDRRSGRAAASVARRCSG